jgi:hypothetical protein
MNLRELHLVFVNSIILPRLEEALFSKPILETKDCQPNQNIIRATPDECFVVIEQEFLLRRFAVQALGVLFRSRTGEGGKRDHYIELLQSVASATPYGIRNWMCRREWVIFSAEEFIRASRFLRGEEIKLKLEGKSAC